MRNWIRRIPAPALIGAMLLLSACNAENGEVAVEEPRPSPAVESLNPPAGQTAMEAAGGMEILKANPFQAAPAAEGSIGGHVQLMVPPVGEPAGLHLRARVEGLSPGPHAWHIHSGRCGQGAPVVVAFTPTQEMAGIDQPLVPGPDRVAEETAFVPESMLTRKDLQGGEYSVHVHRAGGVDHGPTVACAEL